MELTEQDVFNTFKGIHSSSTYTFYKNKEDFSSKTNGVKVTLPSAQLLFLDPDFKSENNVTDRKSLANYLNTIGYCRGVVSKVSPWGLYFDTYSWTWCVDSYADSPLVTFKGSKSTSFGKIEIIDLYFDNYSVQVVTRVVANIPGVPNWMCDKQHYKFVPDQYEFKHLARDSTEQYLGMEFEIDSDYTPVELQYLVTQVEPKQEPFFYFKHDGTIEDSQRHEHAYEVVTLPCTPKYLKRNMRIFFDKVQRELDASKFHAGATTGVHVHLSKDAFFSKLHLRKFNTIWNQYDRKNRVFIEALGKRMATHYCKPNERLLGTTLARRLRDEFVPYGSHPDKYSACRMTNNTTEVRVFKGGFDYDHAQYCIDVVCAMFDFSDVVSIKDIGSPRFEDSFKAWLKKSNYRNLKKEIM